MLHVSALINRIIHMAFADLGSYVITFKITDAVLSTSFYIYTLQTWTIKKRLAQ